MLRKMLMGAGMAYAARRFMGGRSRSMSPGYSRGGLGSLFGGSRFGRRDRSW